MLSYFYIQIIIALKEINKEIPITSIQKNKILRKILDQGDERCVIKMINIEETRDHLENIKSFYMY